MLKALTGLIKPRLANLASGAIVRNYSSYQDGWEPQELPQTSLFKPVNVRSTLLGSALLRNYGESLAYRKYFFMKSIRIKGQLSYRGKRKASSSWNKAVFRNKNMYKLKTCNSMKVGPRHARLFKVLRAGSKHLMRNKSRGQRRRYNTVKYIHDADLWRVKKMLPYWKRQKFKLSR